MSGGEAKPEAQKDASSPPSSGSLPPLEDYHDADDVMEEMADEGEVAEEDEEAIKASGSSDEALPDQVRRKSAEDQK